MLSESLQKFANRAADMEKRVAAAKQQTREKVEASIEASKADAKARQSEFKAKIKQGQAAAASQWEELQAHYNQRVEQIKSKIEARKESRERNRAVNRADDAEAYADASIGFALMAIDDAEVAVLEAIYARAYAESLV